MMLAPHTVILPWYAINGPSHLLRTAPVVIGLGPCNSQSNVSPILAISIPSAFERDADVEIFPGWVPGSPSLAIKDI